MLIADKQSLRRCIKQVMRRSDVVETLLDFDVQAGELGVEAALSASGLSRERLDSTMYTPLRTDEAAFFASLDALQLPVRDIDRAVQMQRGYTREAYLRTILDVMHARCVLVRVPLARAQEVHFTDDRLGAVLAVTPELFAPGRFGAAYGEMAKRIAEGAALADAKHVRLEGDDAAALAYCLLPLCEEHALTLHVQLQTSQAVSDFVCLLDGFAHVHAVVSAQGEAECSLIELAASRERLRVQLSDPQHLTLALSKLGLRFTPYAACASQPELMLGRWILARERLCSALCEAYLPLARAGLDIDSQQIARDAAQWLCGCETQDSED